MLYQNGFGLVSFYQQSPVFAIGNFPFLLLLVTGLAQQLEHIALIELHTGLIEGIHIQNMAETPQHSSRKKNISPTFRSFSSPQSMVITGTPPSTWAARVPR